MEDTIGQKEKISQGAKGDTGKEEILRKPLVGQIIQAIRVNKDKKEVIVFANERGEALEVELPPKQAEKINGFLTEIQEERRPSGERYFWVCTEGGAFGLRGLVLAGPLGEGENRSKRLLTEEQKGIWFHGDFVGYFTTTGLIHKINVEGELSFRTGRMEKASLENVFRAFKEEEDRVAQMYRRYVRK